MFENQIDQMNTRIERLADAYIDAQEEWDQLVGDNPYNYPRETRAAFLRCDVLRRTMLKLEAKVRAMEETNQIIKDAMKGPKTP